MGRGLIGLGTVSGRHDFLLDAPAGPEKHHAMPQSVMTGPAAPGED